MRTYIVDPHARSVTEIAYDGDYKKIYELIGADTFDVVRWADNVDVFVDDEGLFKEGQAFFKLHNRSVPLAGKALVTGTDDEGDTIACPWSLARVASLIEFQDLEFSHMEPIPEGATTMFMGKEVPLVGHTAVFRPK